MTEDGVRNGQPQMPAIGTFDEISLFPVLLNSIRILRVFIGIWAYHRDRRINALLNVHG